MAYKRLKAFRIMNDVSQREMASKLNMAISTYNPKENRVGNRDFSVEEAKQICDILGEKFEDIFLTKPYPY